MKLLTFNDDYADEHNVPALQCFTEGQFIEWCNQKMGRELPNYEDRLFNYKKQNADYNVYIKKLMENELWTKRADLYTPEEKEWMAVNKVDHPGYDAPKKGKSYICAYLGNHGDCFEYGYNNLLTGQDFIDNGCVTVRDVSDDFYNTFHAAGLANLSLCNVFSLGLFDDDEEYDDEE